MALSKPIVKKPPFTSDYFKGDEIPGIPHVIVTLYYIYGKAVYAIDIDETFNILKFFDKFYEGSPYKLFDIKIIKETAENAIALIGEDLDNYRKTFDGVASNGFKAEYALPLLDEPIAVTDGKVDIEEFKKKLKEKRARELYEKICVNDSLLVIFALSYFIHH